MRVKTFIGKVTTESISQMDEHINHWLEENKIEPKHITQSFGTGRHHEVASADPVLIISIWY